MEGALLESATALVIVGAPPSKGRTMRAYHFSGKPLAAFDKPCSKIFASPDGQCLLAWGRSGIYLIRGKP